MCRYFVTSTEASVHLSFSMSLLPAVESNPTTGLSVIFTVIFRLSRSTRLCSDLVISVLDLFNVVNLTLGPITTLIGPVIYLGGLQPFFPVTKGVEKILVTMF